LTGIFVIFAEILFFTFGHYATFFLSLFLLWGGTLSLGIPALRPASQAAGADPGI